MHPAPLAICKTSKYSPGLARPILAISLYHKMNHQNRINLQVLNIKCSLNIYAVDVDFEATFFIKIKIYAFKNPF